MHFHLKLKYETTRKSEHRLEWQMCFAHSCLLSLLLATFESCMLVLREKNKVKKISGFPDSLSRNSVSQQVMEIRLLLKGVQHHWALFLETLCIFSKKIKQPLTKYPMNLVKNVPRNSKITVLLQERPLL